MMRDLPVLIPAPRGSADEFAFSTSTRHSPNRAAMPETVSPVATVYRYTPAAVPTASPDAWAREPASAAADVAEGDGVAEAGAP